MELTGFSTTLDDVGAAVASGPTPRLTRVFLRPTLKPMEVAFTPDQKAFIRKGIEIGRFHSEEDAVQEALLLWEERERRRLEILAAVDQSDASLASGRGRRVTTREEAQQLAADVKDRGLARLATDKIPGR